MEQLVESLWANWQWRLIRGFFGESINENREKARSISDPLMMSSHRKLLLATLNEDVVSDSIDSTLFSWTLVNPKKVLWVKALSVSLVRVGTVQKLCNLRCLKNKKSLKNSQIIWETLNFQNMSITKIIFFPVDNGINPNSPTSEWVCFYDQAFPLATRFFFWDQQHFLASTRFKNLKKNIKFEQRNRNLIDFDWGLERSNRRDFFRSTSDSFVFVTDPGLMIEKRNILLMSRENSFSICRQKRNSIFCASRKRKILIAFESINLTWKFPKNPISIHNFSSAHEWFFARSNLETERMEIGKTNFSFRAHFGAFFEIKREFRSRWHMRIN